MRVLTLTHNYPRFPGDPAGAFVARLAKGAVARGVGIAVVAPRAPGAGLREEDEGVFVRRFRFGPAWAERVAYRGNLHQRAFLSPATAIAIPMLFGAFWSAATIARREFRPALVHAHWWIPAGWIASRQPLPYLVTLHGSDARLLDRSAWMRRLAGKVLGGAARITTVSGFLARDLADRVPHLASRIVVAPMPVDVQHFSRGLQVAKAAPPRILYAGNLVASKGVDVVIRAFGILRAEGISCVLRVVGEGPELEQLRHLAASLGVAQDVSWSPFVSQDRMPAEYGAATVTVLASRGKAEGLGLTLVEALLAGSSVVGTAVGGIPEVVADGETGLLARDGDERHLADRLRRILEDADLRGALVAEGRRRALERFSPERCTQRFLSIYQDVGATPG